MIFTIDDLDAIINEWHNDFKVIRDDITDNGRWTIEHRCLFQEKATGDYYVCYYQRGATEMQECEPFECYSEETELLPLEVEEFTIKGVKLDGGIIEL